MSHFIVCDENDLLYYHIVKILKLKNIISFQEIKNKVVLTLSMIFNLLICFLLL